MSISVYILAGAWRSQPRCNEASMKYFLMGAFATGFLLYGIALLYGATGTVRLDLIAERIATVSDRRLLFAGMALLLIGFGFKVAAVPFHMWTPDAYEGAPTSVTALMAVAVKAAGFAAFTRVFLHTFAPLHAEWSMLLWVVAAATMTVGNVLALVQRNMKRMLAYSSIAHAGYMLMGFVVLNDEGLRAMLFYVVTYYLMSIGAFLVVMIVVNSTGREDIDGFRGLAWRGGAVPAVAMAIFLFSLAGLPPLAGFIGKFYLFAAVVNAKFYLLALVGLLNSLVALYYYARVVRTMFLDMPTGTEGVVTLDAHNACLLYFLALPTLVLGVYWAPVIDLADRSVHFFVG
jgi:NADH-quinone oxidoreductase subunit N